MKKKLDFKSFFSKFKIKKYNYDINSVIGIKDNKKFILFIDKKLIRIYHGNLKSKSLLCSYVPIENAIFYSFNIEKNVIEKIDLDNFVEMKVYEEAGLLETEEYIIKYKIIDKLNDYKKVMIQCVIVPVSFIKKYYQPILKHTDYIDYISFPAFAYKSIYSENILKKANDLFVVILYDKIFLTFYSEGELLSIITITGGLNKIYENLENLKISNLNIELFKKILIKKGLDITKYASNEVPVLIKIEEEMQHRVKLIQEQILNIVEKFDLTDIDRVFITSEYGEIPGINLFFEKNLDKKSLGFEFYKKYNLDRLDINPFLFLAMLETHYAYHENDMRYNYSLFLRKPTFLYRPSGILISSIVILIFILSIYPLYLYKRGEILSINSHRIYNNLNKLSNQKTNLLKYINNLKKSLNRIQKQIILYKKNIKSEQQIIKNLYKFKYAYIPKSKEIVDITLLMNRFKIYMKTLNYANNEFILNVYTSNDKNLGKFVNALVQEGFNADFDTVKEKNGKYYTIIRIRE